MSLALQLGQNSVSTAALFDLVSREGREGREGMVQTVEDFARIAVDCGLKVHQRLGPGLLESAYELVLASLLADRGLAVERQKPISIEIDGVRISDAFRADILIEGILLLELKAVERLAPVHGKQVLTYLRFLQLPVGLLMNFSGATFKEGLRRIVNEHVHFSGSTLDIHHQGRKIPASRPSRSSRET